MRGTGRDRGEIEMKRSQESIMTLKNSSSSIKRPLTCTMLTIALLIQLSLIVLAQSTPSSQLTITVSSQGMTPATATVVAGIVHLLVKNTSSVETLRLRVVRENGELVKEMTAPNGSDEWAIELELSAGQYTISEASNTAWSCHLTVQAPPSSGGLLVPANP
jgi:hypothetical protein